MLDELGRLLLDAAEAGAGADDRPRERGHARAARHTTAGPRAACCTRPAPSNHAHVSAAVTACDVMLQPFIAGVCGRHSSVSALLAHGCAIATNSGRFTEPDWIESRARSCSAAVPSLRRLPPPPSPCWAIRPSAGGCRRRRDSSTPRASTCVTPSRRSGPDMRIAVIAHSATRAGGVETYLAGVIPALMARGHEVACWFESAGRAPSPSSRRRISTPVWIAKPATRGLRSLREWRPDVIYHHGLRAVELERQLPGIAPVVFFAHSYYGSCISGEKATRVPAATPCHRVFGPACLGHYLPRRCGGLSPLTMVQQYRRAAAEAGAAARVRRRPGGQRSHGARVSGAVGDRGGPAVASRRR